MSHEGDIGEGTASRGGHTGATVGVWVRDVVREVVTETAPEELLLMNDLARFDDAAVVRRLRRRGGRREPLGFGLSEIAALVTPVVWLVLDQMAKKAAGTAVDGMATGAKAVLHAVFRRKSAPVAIPPLTPGQLAEVRKRVLETAAHRGLEQERATAIADAVVARLALSDDGDEPV